MAETPSNMLPLGTIAPDFTLLDTISNKMFSLKDLTGKKATIIMFLCNHCPYVKHIQPQLVTVANQYQNSDIHFIAICSNDAKNYPTDAPDKMKLEAEKQHYPFPYLYDETQEIAKAYQAACTPDFYIFDHTLACVYRGRFDSSTPGNHHPVTGIDLKNALDHILSNQSIDTNQYPSVGCNIKWKK